MEIRNFLDKIKIKVINLCFPSVCIFCKKTDEKVCNQCFTEISEKPIWKQKLDIEVFSIYEYQNTKVKKLLQEIKYYNGIDIARKFGKVLAKHLANKDFIDKNIFLLPIPLSGKDSRLYNHTEEIAKNINLKNTKVISNLFIKNTTVKQAHTKSRNERLENIKNKIEINKNILSKSEFENQKFLENTIFILIDDIATTGATLNECKNVLEKQLSLLFPQPSKIIAFTIAS